MFKEEVKETVVIPRLNIDSGQTKALTKRSVNNSSAYHTKNPKNIIDDFSSYIGSQDLKNSYNTCKSGKQKVSFRTRS